MKTIGLINPESKKEFSRIISQMKERGAEAVILGCTEIGLLIHPEDSVLKTFDTTEIHAKRLKKLGGGGYFKELLDRIRDIRASEEVFYRQVHERKRNNESNHLHTRERRDFGRSNAL